MFEWISVAIILIISHFRFYVFCLFILYIHIKAKFPKCTKRALRKLSCGSWLFHQKVTNSTWVPELLSVNSLWLLPKSKFIILFAFCHWKPLALRMLNQSSLISIGKQHFNWTQVISQERNGTLSMRQRAIWINDGFPIKFGFYIENVLRQVIRQFIVDLQHLEKSFLSRENNFLTCCTKLVPNRGPQGELWWHGNCLTL